MANIQLEGLNSVREMLAAIGPGLEKANEKAQNKMAKQLMYAEREQAKSDLDRPKPFTVSSIGYKQYGAKSLTIKSDKKSATLNTPDIKGAGLFVADLTKQAGAIAESYFGVQMLGGTTAKPRKSELFLQKEGFMPQGMVWVPASGAQFDAYGNITGPTIWSMMRELANNKGRGPNYFMFSNKGVFVKRDGQWMPFLWFVTPRQYAPKLDFQGRAESEIASKFNAILSAEVEYELRKAAGG